MYMVLSGQVELYNPHVGCRAVDVKRDRHGTHDTLYIRLKWLRLRDRHTVLLIHDIHSSEMVRLRETDTRYD